MEIWDSSVPKESLQVFASVTKPTLSGSPLQELQLLLRPIELRRSSLGELKHRLVKLLGADATADQYALKIKGHDDFLLFDNLLIIQYRHALHELIAFCRLRVVLIDINQAQRTEIVRVREHLSQNISDGLLLKVFYDDFNGGKFRAKSATPGESPTSNAWPNGAHSFLEAMRSEIGAQAVTVAIKQGALQPWDTITSVDEKRRCVIVAFYTLLSKCQLNNDYCHYFHVITFIVHINQVLRRPLVSKTERATSFRHKLDGETIRKCTAASVVVCPTPPNMHAEFSKRPEHSSFLDSSASIISSRTEDWR